MESVKQFKKYLKSLDEEHLINLFKLAELNELEYWLAFYAIAKKRMVENTCMKLNISRTLLHDQTQLKSIDFSSLVFLYDKNIKRGVFL